MEYIQTSKLIKTGNSLCIVIPKNILKALQMERGDQVVFGILPDGSLMIKKVFFTNYLDLKTNIT